MSPPLIFFLYLIYTFVLFIFILAFPPIHSIYITCPVLFDLKYYQQMMVNNVEKKFSNRQSKMLSVKILEYAGHTEKKEKSKI